MSDRDVRYEPGYWWFILRHKWACFWRDMPWRLAWWLPRSVALSAFIRVYSIMGECGPEFKYICDEWERHGKA